MAFQLLNMRQDGPKMAQDGPNMATGGSKMGQDGPKWPKTALRWPPDGPQRLQIGVPGLLGFQKLLKITRRVLGCWRVHAMCGCSCERVVT